MFQINFHKPIHIHFIGIGGISMSGLAEILLERRISAFPAPTRKRSAADGDSWKSLRTHRFIMDSGRQILTDGHRRGGLYGCDPPG